MLLHDPMRVGPSGAPSVGPFWRNERVHNYSDCQIGMRALGIILIIKIRRGVSAGECHREALRVGPKRKQFWRYAR